MDGLFPKVAYMRLCFFAYLKHFLAIAAVMVQVEHTVTEEITQIDLVQAQIKIAGGATLESLGIGKQEDIPPPRGYAIQCRITCEDPERNFQVGLAPMFWGLMPCCEYVDRAAQCSCCALTACLVDSICAVLCCVVLCCAVLCCAVLRCAVLRCAVLCCAALRCAVLHALLLAILYEAKLAAGIAFHTCIAGRFSDRC